VGDAFDAGQRSDLAGLRLGERQLCSGQEEVVNETLSRLSELREVGEHGPVGGEDVTAAARPETRSRALVCRAGHREVGSDARERVERCLLRSIDPARDRRDDDHQRDAHREPDDREDRPPPTSQKLTPQVAEKERHAKIKPRAAEKPLRIPLIQTTSVKTIDLGWQDSERLIAAYLLETDDGPALVDCGPATCLEALKRGLASNGVALGDLRHLLLTHIHLDHAGAAGTLVREHPVLQIHVSEVGAPHLVDPSRLERSARRIYEDEFDSLFGELASVPEANVHVVGDRVVGLECFPSPGHASHHVCYANRDGTLFVGDAGGVRIQPGRFIAPHAPPPDIDLAAWTATFGEIERRAPKRLALPHFGLVEDVDDHLARTRDQLMRWSERVRGGFDQQAFVESVRSDLVASDPELEPFYARAAPFWQSHAGLRRYWDKREEAGSP
jgi:glyoxylase-like metal-dependent hydrolase (beta-lactamase superfamily II)